MLMKSRMVLGDDVGLGKTLEALVTLSYIKAAYPDVKALVLTEKIVLKQWKREIEWLTTFSAKIITAETHPDPNTRVAALRQFDADILISTYSLMYKYRKYVQEGLGSGFVLICDEPNYFKTTTSVIHREMYEMSHQASRVYGLTATVLENRLEEAFGIFRVVCPGLIESKAFFEKEFCIKRKLKRPARWVVCGYKNLDKFRALIGPAFYGRLQDDPEVMQDLPEAIPKDLPIELSVKQSNKVVEAIDRIVQLPDGSIVNIEILPSLIFAQQMVDDPRLKGFDIDSAKTEALIETLKNSLAGERVIVYCNFRSHVIRLQDDLRKAKIESLRITGLENEEQRQLAVERFMSEGGINVLVGNRAMAKSVNLQKAGHLFFVDMPWSYGLYRQMVGRIKRTGSKFKTVGIYRLQGTLHPSVAKSVGTEETIDHYVLATVMRKKLLFDALTGDTISIETSSSDLLDIWSAVRCAYKKV